MKHKDTLTKAAKIAGVTCLALGSIAVISSGAAINNSATMNCYHTFINQNLRSNDNLLRLQ